MTYNVFIGTLNPTHFTCTTRPKFFGHTARADPSMDHSTVEPLGPVRLLCEGTGTADRADRVALGSGPLNLI